MKDSEFEESIREEKLRSRRLAHAVASACSGTDYEAFLSAVDEMNLSAIDGWRLALRRIGRLQTVSPEIKRAFLGLWIELKHLPFTVAHRPTMAKALRVLMADNNKPAEPLTLYRGTSARERRSRLYGFSWTTDLAIARQFAEDQVARQRDAVVLMTVAVADAILLMREKEVRFDEREVVVDPYRLGKVHVVERLPVPS